MLGFSRCAALQDLARKYVKAHRRDFRLWYPLRKDEKATMKVLNVAEKNDAAKNIAGVLSRGAMRRRDGLSKYNKIYEFYAQLWGANCQMLMTSVSGHLLGYDFVGAYRSWQGCNPLSLFDAPVVKQCTEKTYIQIKQTLEREVRACDALIIWTDCDREGENIGFEVIQVCQAIKPNIRIHRAKFSEITQTSINRALQNLGAPDKKISDAVDVRSELDLRIGAAFTRFQTMRLQSVFPATLAGMLISYGSCQFPTLGFVVERFLAIERFKPELYWKIRVVHQQGELSVEFRWDRHRLFEELPCRVLLDACQERPDATVEKVTVKPKSKWRPLPLDTVELEKQGSRKLRLNAKETMRIAERLYTQGFISYPRTETNIFPKELDLAPLVQQQVENTNWGGFAQRVLTDGVNPRQGKKSDQAHPPIHPTKYTDALEGNEAKVYEFVVRHFLACVSKNAEGNETIVSIDIAGEKFTANGLTIIAKNYLEVYVYEKWNAKEIHVYEQGQIFRPTDIDMVNEQTSPPSLLTEADLIALMDKHGIGTDATHAEHIETIKSRQYVGSSDGQHLVPGKLGIGLVMGYDSMGFEMSKPNLRAELERDLKLICEGRKEPQAVLQDQISKYRDVFRVAMERANMIDNSLSKYLNERPIGAVDAEATIPPRDVFAFKCPKCGSDMTLKDRKNNGGKYIGCMAYPTCSNSVWFPRSVEDVEVLDEKCARCSGDLRKLKLKLKSGAFPLFGTNYTTCIGCDSAFNETMGIREDSVRRAAATNDSGYGGTAGAARSTQASGASGAAPNDPRGENPRRGADRRAESAPVGLVRPAAPRRNNAAAGSGGNSGNSTSFANSWSGANKTWGDIDEGAVIMCNCHEQAIQLTVRKEGPNQGRLFYKCAKPQGTGCNFFLWATNSAEEGGDTGGRSAARVPPLNSNADGDRGRQSARPGGSNRDNFGGPSGDSHDVVCTCGQPARKFTVHKEGPNTGRQFYTCPKTTSKCQFFKWVEEADETFDNFGSNASRGRGRGSRRGRDGAEGPTKTRAPAAKRKCGICGNEGHTRRTCPNNAMD